MNHSPEPPREISRKTVFRLVLMVVLSTLVALFCNALWQFAGNTYDYNNRFKDVAVGQHLLYLIWSNIEVLKGYGLVAAGFTIFVYPLVLLWRRVQVFGRWGVIWRALLLCGMFYAFFIFRLMIERPYFGDYSYFDSAWRTFAEWCGPAVQQAFAFFVLYVFPWVAGVLCGCVLHLGNPPLPAAQLPDPSLGVVRPAPDPGGAGDLRLRFHQGGAETPARAGPAKAEAEEHPHSRLRLLPRGPAVLQRVCRGPRRRRSTCWRGRG